MITKYINKNFFIILAIFLLDRISKLYVIFWNKQNFDTELFSSSFLNIVLVWNDGIAFGLLSSKEDYFYNIITLLIILVATILLYLIYNTRNLKKYFYILIFGGALGNLFDRIVYRSVPDFLDLHYNGFHWFIFNVADIFITIGVICLIYDEILLEKKREYEY